MRTKETMMKIVGAVLLVWVASAAAADEPCVEVEIGGDKALAPACVNRHFRKQVESVRPFENLSPLQASSPALAFGGFNLTALRQQYGTNLGKSAIPYRPARSYGANLSRVIP